MGGELLLDARLELIDPMGEFLVRGEQLAHTDEGTHDLDVHRDGGRAAIAARYKEELAQLGRVVGGGLVQEGVAVSGGMIYEWGHGWLAFQKDGKRQVSSGPYFTVWRRNPGGNWQILRNLVL